MQKIFRFWLFLLLTALGGWATIIVAHRATQGTWYVPDLLRVIGFGCCACLCLVLSLQQAIRLPDLARRPSNASPDFANDTKVLRQVNGRRTLAGMLDVVSLVVSFPLAERLVTYLPPTPFHGFNEASFTFVLVFLWFLVSQVVLPMRWRKTFGMLLFDIRFYRSTDGPAEPRHFWYRAMLVVPVFLALVFVLSLPFCALWMKKNVLVVFNWHNDFAGLTIGR